ncbi:hypothetical protein BDC45DRAFT_474640 [Circinella umbellata]|nr:hypothetical protein BDC45DRAFT_474640 [Circinella umbellata]
MHDSHNPFSEQDIKESRLPFDVKNWIEKHVEEKKDWRGMKDLLQLSNEEMNEFENEINTDPNILKIPAALRVHRHDIVNQIQQRLNNISRKHRFDKQSTQAWINILKEKGYDTLFEIINTSEADEKANGSKKELLMVAWIAPWQKKILLKQEDINLDSTHKTCVSFLSDHGDCYLFSLVTRSDVTNKGCPVAFFYYEF